MGAVLALLLLLVAPAHGAGGGNTGGMSSGGSGPGSTAAPGPKAPASRPSVSALSCVSRCAGTSTDASAATTAAVAVAPKGILSLRGRNLGGVRTVVFTGAAGLADDVGVPIRRAAPAELRLRAPTSAATGPLRAIDASGAASRPTRAAVLVAQPAAPPAPAPPAPAAPVPAASPLDPVLGTGHVFPIQGAHDFGGPGGRFGALRSGHVHQGQDTMAACDTPLVAARGGTVKANTSQAAAGNYLVIAGDTGYDYAYMHLRDPALPPKGATVATGQPIGFVGQTGDATACHLHFELWTAPGWYTGGAPIDPLPALQAWDAGSAH